MQIYDVEVAKIDATEELSDNPSFVCYFCNKMVKVNKKNRKSCSNLSGGNFYCSFCLRNNHHHRSSRNVLAMSYRAISGYYYYRLYNTNPHPRKMWLSEIKNQLIKHSLAGLQNPVFSYDPQTYLWFVNFDLVGKHPSKAPFDEVAYTAKSMLEAFEIEKHLDKEMHEDMWEKFEKALKLFYGKRKRPKDRRFLIPTFSGSRLPNLECYQNDEGFFDATRDFNKADLVMK